MKKAKIVCNESLKFFKIGINKISRRVRNSRTTWGKKNKD